MTVPHYGKRRPGSLTAASPGDTLYFAFGSYNDSGDNEAMTGFAVTDIEVFKNGIATARATDSGISLISDTGQVADRLGLFRFSLQLFNTADDTGHYDPGSWYQVAVDSVTIDGKTVRFWAGSFEIDNVPADTGAVANAVWNAVQSAHTTDGSFGVAFADMDTGIRDRLDELDTGMRSWVASDTGLRVILAAADTGKIATAVWAGDTGLRDHIDNSDTGVKDVIADLDTGLRGILQTTGVNVTSLDSDTGAADRLGKFAGLQLKTDGTLDTGTGQTTNTLNVTATATTDTGQISNAVWNSLVADHATDSTFGVKFDDMDTGIRTAISQISATVDTGVVNQAVWQGNASRTLTAFDVDTGLRDLISDKVAELDTGLRFILAAQDTGKVATAVWAGDTGLRDLISEVDTGLRDTLADYDTGIRAILNTTGVNIDKIDGDTGAANQLMQAFLTTPTYFQQVDVQRVDTDTGAATHLQQLVADGFHDTGLNDRLARIGFDVDTGLRSQISDVDTGIHDIVADLDTGLRDLITDAKNELDTGIKDVIADLDTGLRFILLTTGVNVDAIFADTGAAAHLKQFTDKLDATGQIDTGTGSSTSKLAVSATATVDTGVINNAIWNGLVADHATDGTFGVKFDDMDTGIRTAISQVSATVDTGQVNQAVWQGNATRVLTANTNLSGLQVNVTQVDTDTGAADRLGKFAGLQLKTDGTLDTGTGQTTNTLNITATATTDTGQVNNAVWNGVRSAHTVAGSFGEYVLADAQRIDGDTGSANVLMTVTNTNSALRNSGQFSDTGINDRLAKILSDTDTGLRDQLSAVDTGIHDIIADLDTGLRGILQTTGVNVDKIDGDTGAATHLQQSAAANSNLLVDVRAYSGGTVSVGATGIPNVNLHMLRQDTGAAQHLQQLMDNGFNDTGITDRFNRLAEDTGGVSVNALFGDTGAAQRLSAAWVTGYIQDTGLQDRLGKIGFDVDTGLRSQISDVDTGLHSFVTSDTGLRPFLNALDTGIRDTLNDYDTGVRALLALRDTGAIATAVWAGDTGLRDHIDNTDTGLRARINTLAEDTGGVNINAIAGDTGAAAHLAQAFAAQSTNSDTGLILNAATIRAQTDKLTFDTGNELQVDIRKVNNITVTGSGASGDEWGP